MTHILCVTGGLIVLSGVAYLLERLLRATDQ